MYTQEIQSRLERKKSPENSLQGKIKAHTQRKNKHSDLDKKGQKRVGSPHFKGTTGGVPK